MEYLHALQCIDSKLCVNLLRSVWVTASSSGYNSKHYAKVSGVYLLIDNIGGAKAIWAIPKYPGH